MPKDWLGSWRLNLHCCNRRGSFLISTGMYDPQVFLSAKEKNIVSRNNVDCCGAVAGMMGKLTVRTGGAFLIQPLSPRFSIAISSSHNSKPEPPPHHTDFPKQYFLFLHFLFAIRHTPRIWLKTGRNLSALSVLRVTSKFNFPHRNTKQKSIR